MNKEEIVAAFYDFVDKDQNGGLSKMEIKMLFKSYAAALGRKLKCDWWKPINKGIKSIDTDKSGEISLEEL